MKTLLEVKNLHTYIDQYHILQGVNFKVKKGEVGVLLGRNGAGKTTTLRTIMGLLSTHSGSIKYKNEEITEMQPYDIANLKVGYVPEDQGIFNGLTVEENMRVAMKAEDKKTLERLEFVLSVFPDLKKYWRRDGANLSGGQKQMLSMARAFVNENDLLLIDEPSKGLAPIVVEQVMETMMEMKKSTTIILVEQNFLMASQIGDSYTLIDDGRTVHEGEMSELAENEELRRKYLGVG